MKTLPTSHPFLYPLNSLSRAWLNITVHYDLFVRRPLGHRGVMSSLGRGPP